MAQLNVRNVPDDLYHRVRLAAACGSERIPKGALERFVMRALRRAIEEPQPGAGLPKLKLCAGCFSTNRPVFQRPKEARVPLNQHQTAGEIIVSTERPAPVPLFNHLLGDESPAAAGMLAELENSSIHEFVHTDLDGTAEQRSSEEAGAGRGPRVGFDLSDSGAIEVWPGLWVGSDAAADSLIGRFAGELCDDAQQKIAVLSAAKEPWHRRMVGYATASAPEGAERLFARRGNHMALNLIDVRKLGPGGVHYVPQAVIDAGLAFIGEQLDAGRQVLVHCNHGVSRAPSIAFLFLKSRDYLSSEAAFKVRYPAWEPSAGLKAYLETLCG